MFLKLEEVHDFLKENSLYDDHTHAIWATKRTGGTSNAYFILAFTLDNLVVLDITAMGKIAGIGRIYPAEEILSAELKKKLLFGYQFCFETAEGIHKLHVNKGILGTKWHAEEFQALLSTTAYSYFRFSKE